MESKRIILRDWLPSDRDAFFEMNSDPTIMEFMPKILSRPESDQFFDEIVRRLSLNRFGFWAVECKNNNEFLGFTGLNSPSWKSHFTPCVEIGWRICRSAWGQGYGTEAAKVALNYGFNTLGLNEIVSFTVPANKKSIRVMEKIGMKRDHKGDFLHPELPEPHQLSHHILYRISKSMA